MPEVRSNPAVDGAHVDAMTMRAAMGRFATGVAVVSTIHAEQAHGMTVNSLTSVSLEPPLLLVCLTSGARTTDAVAAAGRFAVNILSARQESIALRFARRGQDHFAGLPLAFGTHAVPVVPDALAHFDCAVERAFEAGDHVVTLGRVERVCTRDGPPLAFHEGRFGVLTGADQETTHWLF